MLAVENVEKSYRTPQGPLAVLKGVSLALAAGETLALTGESGSGKSTLLHLAAGLDEPDAGEIRVDGSVISTGRDTARATLRGEKIGLVFQQFNLIPSLSVGANIDFQARLAGGHDPAWSALLAQRLGLETLLERAPEQLSGGQQQRVAVGRALASRPPLILGDEPTGALDVETGDRVLDLMLELASESGAAVLVVTHSERIAARLGRRLHLESGKLADPVA